MIVAELRPCSSEIIPQTFRKHFRSSSFESRKRSESYHGPVMRTCRLPSRIEDSMLFLTANSGHFPIGMSSLRRQTLRTDKEDGSLIGCPGEKKKWTQGSPRIIWIILIFLHNAISFVFVAIFGLSRFRIFGSGKPSSFFFFFNFLIRQAISTLADRASAPLIYLFNLTWQRRNAESTRTRMEYL